MTVVGDKNISRSEVVMGLNYILWQQANFLPEPASAPHSYLWHMVIYSSILQKRDKLHYYM